MLWSKFHLYTLKQSPSDAEIPSHQLLVRGGYIKKLAPGIHTYGPLMLRSIRKFEAIIREELNQRGGIEILMPMVQPKELWEETNRWEKMSTTGLLRFQNRNKHDFCLGATHEEAVTDYIRNDIKSYRDLPKIIYQIQTKFRDEIRPRFGLMRGREFLMKDAYSFDKSKEEALKNYELMDEAYRAIFTRLGVEFAAVKADSGAIGGDQSQEFHVLAESGEDRLFVSEDRSFAANAEVCPALHPDDELPPLEGSLEEFATPGLKKISTLSKALEIPPNRLVKTLFLNTADEKGELSPIALLVRGSDELNPIKVKNFLGLSVEPVFLTDKEVHQIAGAWPGSCGPVGLKIPVFMDQSVESLGAFIAGANKDGFHLKNITPDRDFKVSGLGDFSFAKAGGPSPGGQGVLREIRGIEVGHIFYLGSIYADAMGAKYLDSDKASKSIEMGCYGIGVTRTLQAIIEQKHDKDGIIWPVAVAPYSVHICVLDPKEADLMKFTLELEQGLEREGFDCFIDDRDERPGVKFKDADLLGMPFRVVIGGRGFKEDSIEVVRREGKEMTKLPKANVLESLLQMLKRRD